MSTKETRPLNKNTFVPSIEALRSQFPWISEIRRDFDVDKGEINYEIRGKLDGIGDIGAVVMYGPAAEEWESGDTVSIGMPIARIEKLADPQEYAHDFEEELRGVYELSEFIRIKAFVSDQGTDLCFVTSYEVDREGFDYQEIIAEFLTDMVEALPEALKAMA